VTITSIGPPAGMTAIQSEFATLFPQATSGATGTTSATDPFAVLLDAAQSGNADPGTTDLTGTGAAGTDASTSGTAGSALLDSELFGSGLARSSLGSIGTVSGDVLGASVDPTSAYLPGIAGSSSATASGTGMIAGQSGTGLIAAQPGTEVASAANGADVVAVAAEQLGTPYVWGGASPSQGFDCSGLVQYTFGQLGISVPRTAAGQEQVGTPVASLAEAQPGDLLFFEPGQNGAPAGEAGHVGIYIGNGQMIAAPQTGQDVSVQTVPGTPLAIRRVTAEGTSATSPTVQMGNVAVPGAYAGLVEQAATNTGVPASLLAGVLQQESGYNPDALSSAGAEGIAQIEPATAAAHGINPYDPASAIEGAATLLAGYHATFGSWSLAAAAYNAGPAAVQQAGGIPANGQTPAYVQNVLSLAGLGAGS
jgi:cell wall-associated NlpC family hydrolase